MAAPIHIAFFWDESLSHFADSVTPAGSNPRVAAPVSPPPPTRDFQSWAPPFDLRWAEWLQSELRLLGWMHGRVTYLFASDDAVLEMNRKHLQHDYYTDILTFDQSHHPVLEVDLAISMERILDHAVLHKISPEQELARVLIHGLLHVSGWDDHSDEDRQAMRRAEEESLQRCPLLSNDHA